MGTDTTAPRIVSVRRTGLEGERTSASTLGFEVTFSEPVHVDPGDLEIARSPGSWRRVEWDIGPHYDEQDRLKAAGDPYYKPCNPDDDRIYANLGTSAGWDLIERLDDECYRREQLSRHWHVLAGGGALSGTIYYEVDLVVAANHDVADVHGNRLEATLPTGDAYQGYIIDRGGPQPRMTADAIEHDGFTPFTVTVDFREPVWGFRVGDLQFNSDRASVVLSSGSDGDSVYVLTVTPLNNTERFIALSLHRGAATDAAGNVNNRAGSVLVRGRPGPGVRFSTLAVSVPEGGSASYTMVLNTQPSANVTITMPSTGDTDITADLSGVVFTPANWSTPQRITLSAREDADSANGSRTINHRISSPDTDYAALSLPSVRATEVDNDTTPLSALSLTAGSSAVTLSPGFSAGTTSYTAWVANDVDTVTVAATAAVTGSTVSISPADGDTSAAGHQVEGLQVGVGKEIRVTVTNAGATRTYTVTVTRTGPPGVTFSTLDLSVPEGGRATYTIVLDAPPSANVNIASATGPGDNDINRTGQGVFDFTPANWDTPQTVTLVALEDDDDALNGVRTIIHIISTTDTAYAALSPLPSLTATEVDNDATALSALSLTAGGSAVTLSPGFSAGTTSYTASVGFHVSTVTVAATAVAAGATASIVPADDDTSVAGHQVDLSTGTNTITVTVTNGSDTRDYTVTVTRPAKPANIVWGALLTVATGSDIVGYHSTASKNKGALSPDSFTVPGTNPPQTVTVKVLGRTLNHDTSYLCFGLDTTLQSSVYSGWTLHFGNEDLALSNWVEADAAVAQDNPCFDDAGPDEVRNVFTSDPSGTIGVCITTDGDDSACPSGTGTTGTGSTEAPADTTLSVLSLSDTDGTEVTLSPAFASGTTAYTASVANGVSTVTVTAAATATGATLAITPEVDADSTSESHQVALSEGENEITVTVIDGTETQTYTVTVTRGAAPAASEVLVSNLGQSQSLAGSFRLYDLAQRFRAGDNAGGYTLTAVDLQMSNGGGDISAVSASVWSVSGGRPDESLGALTNPGSLDGNLIARFTTPGIDLAPSTGYFVVFDSPGAGGSPSLTGSDDEDAGAATGWRVWNTRLFRGSSATAWSVHGQVGRIAVHGFAKAEAAGTQPPEQQVLQPIPGTSGPGVTETPEPEVPQPVAGQDNEPDPETGGTGDEGEEEEADEPADEEDPEVVEEVEPRDPDIVGVAVRSSGDFLKISDGETGTYTVVLEGPPTHAVTIAIEKDFGPPLLSASPATLVFTADDWNQPRQVTVSSPPDGDSMSGNGLFFHTVSSDDAYYDGIGSDDVRVRSTDYDNYGGGGSFRAWLARLPAQHSGRNFTVRLGFDAVPESLGTTRVGLSVVATRGGRVSGVRRVNRQAFDLTVRPDGNADVVMSIRPTGLCGGARDVCTRRNGASVPLQIGYEAWVPGPLD